MDKAHAHPAGDQRSLALDHRLQQTQVGGGGAGQCYIVTRDGVVGQPAQQDLVASGGDVLEGAYTQVAGCHARQDGARQDLRALYGRAGGYRGQRARGGDA